MPRRILKRISGGSAPTRRNPRDARSTQRIWSRRTAPETTRPSGRRIFVGQGVTLLVIGQMIAVAFRRWKVTSDKTTAGRMPLCSRPSVGLRSTQTTSPASGTGWSAVVIVTNDLRTHVRSPIEGGGAMRRTQSVHLGDHFSERRDRDAVHGASCSRRRNLPLRQHFHRLTLVDAELRYGLRRQSHDEIITPANDFWLPSPHPPSCRQDLITARGVVPTSLPNHAPWPRCPCGRSPRGRSPSSGR